MMDDSRGDLVAAEAGYQRALELDPNLTVAQNNLAMIIANRDGDLERAIALATKAVKALPDNPSFRDTLAEVLIMAGRQEEAIEHMTRVVQGDPDNVTWRINLAHVLFSAGQPEQARQVIDRMAPLDESNRKVPDEMRQRLNQLKSKLAEEEGTPLKAVATPGR